MANVTDKDFIARDRIIKETDKNFFVKAGAGSGKTTMLVNRMVAMVEAGIDVSEISAITFTKAAAGEFYKRFQEKLIQRCDPNFAYVNGGRAGELPGPTADTRKRCERALQNIDLCFMGTIDSFCKLVLDEHPREGGVPFGSNIIEDKALGDILRQEYVKCSDGLYGKELEDKAKQFSKVNYKAEETFVEAMRIIMSNRNSTFQYSAITKPVDVDAQYAKYKSAVLGVLSACQQNRAIIYTGNKKSVEAGERLIEQANVFQGNWTEHLSNVISALKKISALNLDSSARATYQLDPLILDAKTKCDALKLEPLIGDLEKLQYNLSMTFFLAAVTSVEKTMRDAGALTFFDYLYYLRNMLKTSAEKDGKLIQYIYDRHKYFLIDEFQDTNPIQAEVFFYLTADKPVSDWTKCVPKPGSLFIVGDPKQSIYRFRGADVASYARVQGLFQGQVGEVLELTRNFRSTEELCKYFNRVFAKMLPEDTTEQSKFEEIPLPRNSGVTQLEGTYYYDCYEGEEGRSKHPGMTDEVQIIKAIQGLVGNPNYGILNEKGAKRPVSYRDFMIITASKKNLGRYVRAFYDAGIPVRVEGKVDFENSQALEAIYGIYAALADASDRIALIRALKGSLIRFSDELLADYRMAGGVLSLKRFTKKDKTADKESKEPLEEAWEDAKQEDAKQEDAKQEDAKQEDAKQEDAKQEDAKQEDEKQDAAQQTSALKREDFTEKQKLVDDMLEKLSKLAWMARELSPSALFLKIMEQFEVFRTVSEEKLEIVCYVLELLRSGEQAGSIVTLTEGAEYVKKLLDGKAEEERCLSLEEDADSVHLANLHKVKGLERPIVILAYSYPNSASPVYRVEHSGKGTPGYIFKIAKKLDSGNNFTLLETAAFDAQKEQEKTSLEAEDARLVYVAATRARNLLLISRSHFIMKSADTIRTAWVPLLDKDVTEFFANHTALTASAQGTAAGVAGASAQGTAAGVAGVNAQGTASNTAAANAQGADADVLYANAQNSSALRKVAVSAERSYVLKTPSKIKIKSKMERDDGNLENPALEAVVNELEEALKTSVRLRQVEVAKAETVKAETVKAETAKAETAKAETVKAETAKAETAKAEAVKAETAKAETAKAEALKQGDASEATVIDGTKAGYEGVAVGSAETAAGSDETTTGSDETAAGKAETAAGSDEMAAGKAETATEGQTEKEKIEGEFRALMGTMVHRLMEMIISSRNQIDKKKAVEQIAREYNTPGLRADMNKLKELLAEVAQQLDDGGYEQKYGVPADVISLLCNAEEVHCEVPFCYYMSPEDENIELESYSKAQVCNGIMDVIYKKDGKWHIIDYKTNAEVEGLEDKYAAQLRAYRAAFREIFGEVADAKIYHIDV